MAHQYPTHRSLSPPRPLTMSRRAHSPQQVRRLDDYVRRMDGWREHFRSTDDEVRMGTGQLHRFSSLLCD